MDSVSSSTSSWFSRTLIWGFRRYVRRFVTKKFNAVRVAGLSHAQHIPAGPIICSINHPGWWDPMTCVLLTDQLFPGRCMAVPMDSVALAKYPILERVGFFSIARDSASGARDFLRISRELLQAPDVILWLTPTGKFCDVRQPASFMPGLSHLVDREFAGTLLTIAIEYTFWNEQSPEMLIEIASPLDCQTLPYERELRTRMLEECMAKTQAALALRAIARDHSAFSTLIIGRSGIGGLYDGWRRLSAWLRGQPFQGRHEAPEISVPPLSGGGQL